MPKWLTCLSLIGVILFLMWLGYAVCIEHMPVKNTMWALAPPVIAIMLALITTMRTMPARATSSLPASANSLLKRVRRKAK